MKVAFFNSHNTWPSHTETELELMQMHLEAEDQVLQIVCNAELPACDINLHHDLHKCIECIGIRKSGLGLLDAEVEVISMNEVVGTSRHLNIELPRSFENIEELQAFTIDGFDVGYATSSSLVSATRNPNPDLNEHKDLLFRFLSSAVVLYFGLQKLIVQKGIEKVYVFNGRFAQVKAALRACNTLGIECVVHERGANKNKYKLTYNTIPHDLSYVKESIKSFWAESHELERREVAESFFIDRASGKEQNWKSFIEHQEEGFLPERFDPSTRNIVVFTSSEDEFVSISPDFKNPFFKDQLEALAELSKVFAKKEGFQLYIRLHPNMAEINEKLLKDYLSLSGQNVEVIDPQSKVSSYALLRECEKVVSFGSMLGVEATYWGRPSILLSRMFYEDLDCTYNPGSKEELYMLLDKELSPKPKVNTYPYAYYVSEFGESYKHYQPDSLFSGEFKGERIKSEPGFFLSILKKSLELPLLSLLRGPLNRMHRMKTKRFMR